jgi:hypothetical protein
VKRTLVGFDFSARADLSSADMETIDLDLRVDGESASAQVTATAGPVHSHCVMLLYAWSRILYAFYYLEF